MSMADWETRSISAHCGKAACEWDDDSPSMLDAYQNAARHADETGHQVTVFMLSSREVKPNERSST